MSNFFNFLNFIHIRVKKKHIGNVFFLHVRLLHSDRDAIPDVPAVYFVMPTEENIDRMCQVTCISHICQK
uniref:Uncharacterized protein n=1 Tax=Serinus canaria TaxID=9135 RepID=A0A8C9MEF1_SERCA